MLKGVMRQLRVGPATISGDLLAAPGRNSKRAVRLRQLHFRDQQRSILSLEAIHHPVPAVQIENMAGFDKAMGRQRPKRLGILHGDGVFELMANETGGIRGCLQGEPGLILTSETNTDLAPLDLRGPKCCRSLPIVYQFFGKVWSVFGCIGTDFCK